jgi:hypothetical protein
LFEYIYRSDGLTLIPHIPTGISELEQKFPIRFGTKKLYLSATGSGEIASVSINGEAWKSFDAKSISLPYHEIPDTACIAICLGDAEIKRPAPGSQHREPVSGSGLPDLDERGAKMRFIHTRLKEAGLGESYEAAHARLALDYISTVYERRKLQSEGKLPRLPESSQDAADKCYVDTAIKLCDGLGNVIESYGESDDPGKKRIYELCAENSKE